MKTPFSIMAPDQFSHEKYRNANDAIDRLIAIYEAHTEFLQQAFTRVAHGDVPKSGRYRATYPEIRLTTDTHAQIDTRLSFGHVPGPGTYASTITRPDLFRHYLTTQIELLLSNHNVAIEVGPSPTPIPVHFAWPNGMDVEGALPETWSRPLRDIFDVPDLAITDDAIVNGTRHFGPDDVVPLAPFTGPRIDYSLHRLAHYTATKPEHFQNFVLFTNYQFYIDEFVDWAKQLMADGDSEYEEFVEAGNLITPSGATEPSDGAAASRIPQMPAYHLKRKDQNGITMVNIGVGPSNAKTITDHIAVLRPHAWLMLGHCAGLRNTQRLGDYVLAHGYVREDHVLDADLPTWVPIPPLAEIQVALEDSVAEITGFTGYDLKRIMRTGTVATIDNRNWELRDHKEPVERLSQSRAVGLDMESATIAANGFRFRVPYGTLLCVSDKPLHGELKLPGMASSFYTQQVKQHLKIGIKALENLREMPVERIHSRKLRSFAETAFQ
ncbi:AMP nucleosidase [Cohaesibacter celericrescens]|uniref:AMP nucleosidase n=1 Tax=Cohaesibacter celericrescens TaxID=2067669 RepID=A0A2N5XSE0_9HYPH|nr:AMP nucleosidase [Cohaesibacter celericrescens]PLW77423.1 AMP nucleosidase [Cohaesibacter celericrescens]